MSNIFVEKMKKIVSEFYKQKQSAEQEKKHNISTFIDSDKKIWGYAKEGHFHFCLENLVEVDRNALGLIDKVLVITKEDDKLSFVIGGNSFSISLTKERIVFTL